MPSFAQVKKPLIALLVGAPLSLGLVACGSGGEAEEGAASDAQSTVTSTNATESEGSATGEPSDESESPEGTDADNPDNKDKADRDAGSARDGDGRDGADAGQDAQGERAAGGGAAAGGAGGAAAGGGRSDTAPTAQARETVGDSAAATEVQSAVQNQFDSAHYANMATLWDHTQKSTCASALEASQQEAKQMMAQELPGEVQGLDVFSLMNDPNVGPVVRQELANQPAPAAPQLNSIDSVEVDGGQATARVNATTDGQATTQTMNFVNEGGTWKLCN